MLLPMSLRSEGFARLDSLIAEHGEDWLLSAFVSRISDGEAPAAVATGMGLPWFVMRRWLEDSGERMSQWELGKRCFADGLVWEGLQRARDAQVETLGVDKFQAEYYQKAAERMSPREWGNKTDNSAGGITVVVQRGLTAEVSQGSHGGVLTIVPSENKGYPVPMEREING